MSEQDALMAAIVALSLDNTRLAMIGQQVTDEGKQAAAAIDHNKQAIKTLEKMLQKVKAA